jgi:hypothetical protein
VNLLSDQNVIFLFAWPSKGSHQHWLSLESVSAIVGLAAPTDSSQSHIIKYVETTTRILTVLHYLDLSQFGTQTNQSRRKNPKFIRDSTKQIKKYGYRVKNRSYLRFCPAESGFLDVNNEKLYFLTQEKLVLLIKFGQNIIKYSILC